MTEKEFNVLIDINKWILLEAQNIILYVKDIEMLSELEEKNEITPEYFKTSMKTVNNYLAMSTGILRKQSERIHELTDKNIK